MSNSTTLAMPPLDLADPVRRRHYFQGFATGILGGILAAFVLPRIFADPKSASGAKRSTGSPDPLSPDSNPAYPAATNLPPASAPSRKQKFAPPPPASVPFREPFSSQSDIPDPVPPVTPASYPDRSYPPYNTEAPAPNLPYGSERTELPLRPDLPSRAARGSDGPSNIPLSPANGSASNGHATTTNGSSPAAGPITFDPRKTS